MSGASIFHELQKKVWKLIVRRGCEEASTALEEMLHMPLAMTGAIIGFVPITKMPFLAGNPEQIVTGARLVFSGDISGHMLLILPMESWEMCKNLLLSQAHGEQSEELEVSAFAEMANIACSFFISNLANVATLTIHFTPPEVIRDMTATVLEDTLIQLSGETTELLTIETTFSSGGTAITGYLFFIPSPSSVKRITQSFLQAVPGLDDGTSPPDIG